jgi:hypothetical protein
MNLATLPPIAEYREEFTRGATPVVTSVWARVAPDSFKQGGWWKEIVFSRISKFERKNNAVNVGTFDITEQVARSVRSSLSKVSLQSLPLPAVVPLSGNGLSLAWVTGSRSVEMTAFADGEITIEALEANKYIELPEDEGLEAVLSWLTLPSETQRYHAAAR